MGILAPARAVIDIADIDVSIKMSFDIRIDTEKGHIDIVKCIYLQTRNVVFEVNATFVMQHSFRLGYLFMICRSM